MRQTLSVRSMAQIAISAALTAVLSQISFPMPSGVPVTLQTVAVALVGFVLGPSMAAAAVGVYLLLGAVGLPVFAQFSGGFGMLIGLTGGFLWGFVPFAALCGLGGRQKRLPAAAALALAGLAACHLMGTAQFSAVTGTAFGRSFLLVSAPYLVKDVASVAAARLLAVPVHRALERSGLRRA